MSANLTTRAWEISFAGACFIGWGDPTITAPLSEQGGLNVHLWVLSTIFGVRRSCV
jgi:hypothetical protein